MGHFDGRGVQLHPAGVRQLHETAGRRLQPLQIRRSQFHSFLFPFGRDGKPVDPAPGNDQFRPQPALGKKEALEGRVAEAFRLRGKVRPGERERIEKTLVCVANPEPRFGSEPVQPPKPLGRSFEPRIVEDFRLLGRALGRARGLPFVTAPLPGALVALAFRQYAEANHFVRQLENKLRHRRMRDAELVPVGLLA